MHRDPSFGIPYTLPQTHGEAGRAREFIEEVLARTKLLRHYKACRDSLKVDIVAHSMGGLVLCEYLAKHRSNAQVNKVASLGVPYLGTVEAVAQILTGSGNLAGPTPAESEREAARITPAIYHLLPSYAGAVINESAADPIDLFSVDAWQKGVLDSLTEYVRLHSVDAGRSAKGNRQRAVVLLERLLSVAKAHRTRVAEFSIAAAAMKPEDWLVIAGIGGRTRLAVKARKEGGCLRYAVGDDLFRDNWWQDPDSRLTGDETVPLLGALPPFIEEKCVVAVIEDDFGFWEFRDRLGAVVVSLHAFLPQMNLVHRLCLRHFRADYRGETWGRPIPGVTVRDWTPPFPLKCRERQASSNASGQERRDGWGRRIIP